MGRKIALLQEIGDDALLEARRAAVDGGAHGAEGGHEIGGDHEIADAQARQQRLAEGARVENAV
ncbi:hypothetical protein D3C87_2039290 [compost metagenome]